ncbi:hypothetical protein, partial [Klebsiella pneumoniae]|uniref:hypothetical protein n=1 Tax=Klebsiella pneumoniae TaxID=573 RepID=UPI001D0E126A
AYEEANFILLIKQSGSAVAYIAHHTIKKTNKQHFILDLLRAMDHHQINYSSQLGLMMMEPMHLF